MKTLEKVFGKNYLKYPCSFNACIQALKKKIPDVSFEEFKVYVGSSSERTEKVWNNFFNGSGMKKWENRSKEEKENSMQIVDKVLSPKEHT